jgi:hypothetical protein
MIIRHVTSLGLRASFGLLAFVIALVAFAPLEAKAQDATSRALFDKGVADMEARRFDTACPELEESLRMNRLPGTTFTLAECYAKAGKSASAVARYQEYLDLYSKLPSDQQQKQEDRPQVSRSQIGALTPSVPTLTIRLPQGAPAGTTVKRDDVVLGGPSLGVALPVDPGSHTITSQAPGSIPFTQTITLAPSEKKDITVTVTNAVGGDQAGRSDVNQPGRGKAQRIAGFVIAGVGAAGLLMGAITGGLTLAKKSTISDNCNVDTKVCKNQTGLDAVDSAHTTGLISTVGFIAGGVVLVGGVVILATAPGQGNSKDIRMSFSADPTGGSIGIGGAF